MLLCFNKTLKIELSSLLNLKNSSSILIACLCFNKTHTVLVSALSRSLTTHIGILLENHIMAYHFDKFEVILFMQLFH